MNDNKDSLGEVQYFNPSPEVIASSEQFMQLLESGKIPNDHYDIEHQDGFADKSEFIKLESHAYNSETAHLPKFIPDEDTKAAGERFIERVKANAKTIEPKKLRLCEQTFQTSQCEVNPEFINHIAGNPRLLCDFISKLNTIEEIKLVVNAVSDNWKRYVESC